MTPFSTVTQLKHINLILLGFGAGRVKAHLQKYWKFQKLFF